MLKLVVIMTANEPFLTFREALASVQEEFPGQFQIAFFDTTSLDDDNKIYQECIGAVQEADFVFVNIFGSLSFYKTFYPLWETYKGKKHFFIHTTIEEEGSELFPECKIMHEDFRMIYQYYHSGGIDNYRNLIKWFGNQFGRTDVELCPPSYPKWSGIYDPDMDIEDEDSYIRKTAEAGVPRIGVLVNVGTIQKKDLKHIDSIIRHIRSKNCMPYCIYSDMVPDEALGCEGVRAAMERYLKPEGEVIVDAIINTKGHSISIIADPGDGSKPKETSIFEEFNVPVFQVMTTMQSYEHWSESVLGLDPLSLSWSVFQPEFDGQLITYPIATTEKYETEFGTKRVSEPIEDRIDAITSLAINWAKLRYIPNQEKKIAIVLHNNPPRNDNIGGAAGLDTPESIYDMAQRLKMIGINLEYDFENGKEIIDKIIAGLTNDGRWTSAENMLARSIDTVSKKTYMQWYDTFIPRIQKNLVKYWDEPVGDFMAVDDQILIPGILNGNVFIGLQPPRAFEEKAQEMYHNTDIPCPHQYIGFYNWITQVFEADIMMHIGTHGTLEFLPGKEVGLSKNCYSDICVTTIPHVYPYIINAPGEGSIAKRRTYAALVDHMIPSMVESGVYDELAEMDELMRQYYHIKAADPKKMPTIQAQIVELAIKMNLNDDIGLSAEDLENNVDECIEKMHSWVSNVQASDINDGFHIFGMVPEGDRYRNMLKMMVRNRNDETPALRKGVCDLLGYDFEALLANPETATEDGRSYGIMMAEVDEIGREMFLRLEAVDYDPEQVETVISSLQKDKHNSSEALKQCLNYACSFVRPRLDRITDEMEHLISSCEGTFVPPGQAGAPTRGNAKILPTGKNFYSVDPGAMPSKSSWKVGITLTEQLIARYLQDDGKYPESVSILVYATEAMRNYGDDIAEAFYLLGTRPVWLGNTDRVIAVEAIPLEELGRPRIDITLRITGLFRDAFPNLVERVEDAVNLVAALDEPYEMNFIKKHVDEEVAELVEQGIDLEVAKKHSLLRVFGDPPGAYGAGVNNVVVSKQWNDVTDLGKVYTNWGAHAYGKNIHGDKLPEVFAIRMKKTSVAVKNESTREFDMLDGDDFYNYFGGMVAAITTHSGCQKPAYIPSTSDTDHIETLTLHEEASRVVRAKVNNPKWIEGLKKHGYRGAKQISGMVDYAFGWDATTGVIDDWMYNCIAERYAFDKENTDWMREVNPWALHSVAERLLEASQRGMWNASEEQVQKLQEIYMEMEGDLEDFGQ